MEELVVFVSRDSIAKLSALPKHIGSISRSSKQGLFEDVAKTTFSRRQLPLLFFEVNQIDDVFAPGFANVGWCDRLSPLL